MKVNKNLAKYKKAYVRSMQWSEEDQVFVVRFPELPGCQAHGADRVEALENADDAVDVFIEALERLGRDIPIPFAMAKQVKKYPLRMQGDLYIKFVELAAAKGISVNELLNQAAEHELYPLPAPDKKKA